MPDEPPAKKGEFALIGRIRALTAGSQAPLPVPPGDDMAAIAADLDGPVLWSADMLMDGVDFRSSEHDWYAIGRKAMNVNLSDCAAMAARPRAALCAVALNQQLSMEAAERLHRGVSEAGSSCNCVLVGGDTNSWAAPTVIAISVAADLPGGRAPITRSGARPGDLLCLSGPVGGSILGRHMTFEPRVALAERIAQILRPTAMIDISDGLAQDLGHICEASGCGAMLDEEALAGLIHADARRLAERSGRRPLDHALHDGEDFELLVTLPADTDTAEIARLGLSSMGVMTAGHGVRMRSRGGIIEVAAGGWEHFR